jgi:hypothetical protein
VAWALWLEYKLGWHWGVDPFTWWNLMLTNCQNSIGILNIQSENQKISVEKMPHNQSSVQK